VHAPLCRVARVRGANVVVVTIRLTGANALSRIADVGGGACIPVVTRFGIGTVLAAFLRVARVVRAYTAVVTIRLTGANALSRIADVGGGACIPVVARQRIEGIRAPVDRAADIVGAQVFVAAGRILRHMLAAIGGVTRIIGAGHAVIAVENCTFLHLASTQFIFFAALCADESAVAGVRVVQWFAVVVVRTDALLDDKFVQGKQLAGAHTVDALVAVSTWIAVAALGSVQKLMLA